MNSPIIIGIAGGTGSGKSTLAEELQRRLTPPGAVTVLLDSYYKDFPAYTEAQKERLNFDHPDAFDIPLLVEHVAALKAGNTVQQPVYDFPTHSRSGARLTRPQPFIILEGILTLAVKDLRPLYDIAVFVDAPAPVRFQRRLARDTEVRGRTPASVERQYRDTVRPMHNRFVQPSRRFAHLIVPSHQPNDIAVRAIVACALSMRDSRNHTPGGITP